MKKIQKQSSINDFVYIFNEREKIKISMLNKVSDKMLNLIISQSRIVQ